MSFVHDEAFWALNSESLFWSVFVAVIYCYTFDKYNFDLAFLDRSDQYSCGYDYRSDPSLMSRLFCRWPSVGVRHQLPDSHCWYVWRVVWKRGRDHESGMYGHHLPGSAPLPARGPVVQRRWEDAHHLFSYSQLDACINVPGMRFQQGKKCFLKVAIGNSLLQITGKSPAFRNKNISIKINFK